MSNLQILSNQIRENGNLYSLNDLHIASGGESKHRPNQFLRLDTTKELIAEMENENQPRNTILVVKNGLGSYACEELVLSYAMWISPKFHLIVLRAFLAMHKGQQLQNMQQLALQKPKTIEIDTDVLDALIKYCKLAKRHGEQLEPAMRTIYTSLGLERYIKNNFAAQAYDLAHEFNYWIDEAERTYLSQTTPRLR